MRPSSLAVSSPVMSGRDGASRRVSVVRPGEIQGGAVLAALD
jgi:hypothetical protein